MRRLMLVLPLLTLAACGMFGEESTDDSSTGAPPPNRTDPLSGTSTSELYVERYNNVKATHVDLKQTLSDRSVNPLRATGQLEEMRNDTKHMALLTAEPYSGQLLEIAVEFDAARDRVRRGTWTQKTVAELDATVRRFTTDFALGRVTLRESVLPDTRPPTNTEKTASTPPDPAVGNTDAETLKSSPWLLYKAWVQEHADLEAAVTSGDDRIARVHYGRVIQLIKWMEDNAAGDQKRRLASYRAEYELTDRKTSGFTRYPDDFSKQKATDTIRIAADSLKMNFNPDTP